MFNFNIRIIKITSCSDDLNKELLISEIQTRPVLWNDRHPNLKNRVVSTKQWDKVAKIVGISGKNYIF